MNQPPQNSIAGYIQQTNQDIETYEQQQPRENYGNPSQFSYMQGGPPQYYNEQGQYIGPDQNQGPTTQPFGSQHQPPKSPGVPQAFTEGDWVQIVDSGGVPGLQGHRGQVKSVQNRNGQWVYFVDQIPATSKPISFLAHHLRPANTTPEQQPQPSQPPSPQPNQPLEPVPQRPTPTPIDGNPFASLASFFDDVLRRIDRMEERRVIIDVAEPSFAEEYRKSNQLLLTELGYLVNLVKSIQVSVDKLTKYIDTQASEHQAVEPPELRPNLEPKPTQNWKKGQPKIYGAASEDGGDSHIEDLAAFCKAHNLNPARMRAVARGEQKEHKGWTCWEVQPAKSQVVVTEKMINQGKVEVPKLEIGARKKEKSK